MNELLEQSFTLHDLFIWSQGRATSPLALTLFGILVWVIGGNLTRRAYLSMALKHRYLSDDISIGAFLSKYAFPLSLVTLIGFKFCEFGAFILTKGVTSIFDKNDAFTNKFAEKRGKKHLMHEYLVNCKHCRTAPGSLTDGNFDARWQLSNPITRPDNVKESLVTCPKCHKTLAAVLHKPSGAPETVYL